jgi:hypothetical protein
VSSIWLFFLSRVLIKFYPVIPKKCRLAEISFFVLLLAESIIFLCREETYNIPIVSFIIISLMAGLIAYQIYYAIHSTRSILFILLQIVLMGFSYSIFQATLFPDLIGMDPWWHRYFTNIILSTGYVPNGFSYSNFPLFHIDVTSVILITGLDYKSAVLYGLTSMQTLVDTIIVFLLGRWLVNYRVGLFAGLVTAISNYHLAMGLWMAPNSMAVVLIPLILYLSIISYRNNYLKILIIILMVTLVFYHTISAMGLAIILIVGYAGNKFYRSSSRDDITIGISATVILLFLSIMFGYWAYGSNQMAALNQFVNWAINMDPTYIPAISQNVTQYLANIPFFENFLYALSSFSVLILGLIGIFYLLSNSNTKHCHNYGFVALSPFVVGCYCLVIGNGLDQRWWYLAQILMSVPFAITIFMILSNRRILLKKWRAPTLACTIVVVITFISIISPIINTSNLSIQPYSTIRYSLTTSELYGYYYFEYVSDSNAYTDQYFAARIENMGGISVDISPNLESGNFTHTGDGSIIVRKDIEKHTFLLSSAKYQLPYNLESKLFKNQYEKVYTSEKISIFR